MPSCTDLSETHPKLGSHMQHHLEAVVTGNLDAARHHLLAFEALLEGHSRSEEELLMPVFADAKLESLGCSVDLLMKEHVKIRRLVKEAHARVFHPNATLEPSTRISWVEAIHMLKEVLSHHDIRERSAFNPLLDQALGTEKATALALKALSRERELEAAWWNSQAPSTIK